MKKMILLSVVLVTLLGCSSQKSQDNSKVIHIASWSHYLNLDLVSDFEKKTGTKISISNYASNEELLAKIQAGATGYDLIVPSDYMILIMKKLELLQPIQKDKLKNWANIDPKLLHKPYDENSEFSVPFAWGTTGFAYLKNKVSKPIKSWKEFFELKEFSLLDDVREVLGAVLKSQGKSLNSIQPNELAAAKKVLVEIKKRAKSFNSETKMPLIRGEIEAAQAYSIDALQATQESKGNVVYVTPEEGGTFWIDHLAIPKGSKNVAGAHEFLDYLISETVAQDLIKRARVAPSNKKTYTSDTSLFPTEKTLSHFEMIQDLGENIRAWDLIWTEIKAERE